MNETNTKENSTPKASLVGRLVRWLFPSTVKRLVKLDAIKDEIKQIELEYRLFGQTNHRNTRKNLTDKHSMLCSDFENKKYWWMKDIKRIGI